MLRVIYNSHRAPLLAPLTTAASIGAAVFSQRNDDSATTPAKKLLLEEPSRWLSFSAILPNYSSNLSSRDKCSCESLFSRPSSHATQSILVNASTKATVESKYTVDWKHPLGEGGFGAVYTCVDKTTGEKYALKKMPKKYTDSASFHREIVALLKMSQSGAHPNICGLHETFDENDNFFLVLDLITGGEMFDHLCQNGAYSEADAAHLVRETASALAFIHGVGLVHADIKPENLMLTTKNKTDSVIKVVDFGCAEMYKDDSQTKMSRKNTVNTPAYCPPEAFSTWKGPLNPSFDMFSMGVVLYIMLTGCHPFDLTGRSTDKEIEKRITTEKPPLRNSKITAHLSDSAIELIEKLLEKNPNRRMTAMQMLEHPWVQGLTADQRKITGSDTKIGQFRKFKSRLEVKIFADLVSGATDDDATDNKSGLIERQFKKIDTKSKGYVTATDLGMSLTGNEEKSSEVTPLSLSEFTDLISDHMMNKYYPEGYEIYKEGSKGDTIYFINSGTVVISTKAGCNATLSQGQLFGEGALLHSTGIRNASVKCATPVHVVAITKEYFNKYMSECGSDTNLNLQELDRYREKERAFQLLSNHKKLATRDLSKGDVLFSFGEEGKSLFFVDEGEIEITGENGKHVLDAKAGQICGEHSLIMKQPRNVTAVCVSDNCKVREMAAKHFNEVYDSSPSVKQSLREFCLRRDFQKAIVSKFGRDFGTSEDELRKVFNSVDTDSNGEIDKDEVKGLIKRIYPFLNDDDPLFTEVMHSLDIDSSDSIKWDEFKKVFLSKKSTR